MSFGSVGDCLVGQRLLHADGLVIPRALIEAHSNEGTAVDESTLGSLACLISCGNHQRWLQVLGLFVSGQDLFKRHSCTFTSFVLKLRWPVDVDLVSFMPSDF